ncbi:MAG: formate dehydrogenase accessory sulfurtransferase FdhD [Firmicutes bacterium]|nr:formate dehydrogenase accessory sulfurtransferase FdhD [Bacillota bacterium]
MERDELIERISQRPVWRCSRGEWQHLDDLVVTEFAATIYLNGNELVTLLCSPEYLEDLAVGFLSGEGLLAGADDLESVKADYQLGQVWVTSRGTSVLAEKTFLKRYLTTGCGKGTTFYSLDDSLRAAPLESSLRIAQEKISESTRAFQDRSELFHQTGGVHSAALGDDGGIRLFREDLGRHNALDKLIGCCVREGIDPGGFFLMVSGRISSEILMKSVKAGLQIVISRSAPTSLAVDLAERLGVTLIGFARGGRFNVYCHRDRVVEAGT